MKKPTIKRLYFDIDSIYKGELYKGELKVRSFSKMKKRNYMSSHITKCGYRRFKLHSKHVLAHHIVAEHFLGPRPKDLTVNHIDGKKLNNHPDNLEYITRAENIKHAIENGLHVSCDVTKMPTYKDGRCANEKEYKRKWYLKNRERILKKVKERYNAKKANN